MLFCSGETWGVNVTSELQRPTWKEGVTWIYGGGHKKGLVHGRPERMVRRESLVTRTSVRTSTQGLLHEAYAGEQGTQRVASLAYTAVHGMVRRIHRIRQTLWGHVPLFNSLGGKASGFWWLCLQCWRKTGLLMKTRKQSRCWNTVNCWKPRRIFSVQHAIPSHGNTPHGASHKP